MYHENVNVNLMVKSVIQIKSGMAINIDASIKILKKHRMCEKDYFWKPAACSCENGKYLANIIENSMIKCNELMKETEVFQQILIKKWPAKQSISIF